MRIVTLLPLLAIAFVCSCGPSSADIKLKQLQDSLRQTEAINKAVDKVKQELGAASQAAAPAAKPANVDRPTTQMVSTPKSGTWVRILRKNVILRNAPSTSASAVKHASPGNEYEYLGRAGDWYMVNYHGTTAYVFGGMFNGNYLCDVVYY